MATEAFVVHVQAEQGDVRLALRGELDRGVVSALDRAYRSASVAGGPRRIVIDISGLDFCDLGGQRELFRYHAAGAILVGAPSCVRRLWALTGHAHMLPSAPEAPWPQASLALGLDPQGDVEIARSA
jgi:anti-anti-sigma regulatory factor